MKPAIPIFTGNVVDSSSGAIKRIRRHVTRPDSSAASSADPARVDRIAVNPPDTYLRQCNPWVRLCEFILPWRLLNDINGSKDSSGAPAVEEMPVLYRTVDDYVARWEAVLLAELKASVLSGITDDTFRNVRTVQLVEFSEARPVGSSLVKLSYRPIEKDPKISSR